MDNTETDTETATGHLDNVQWTSSMSIDTDTEETDNVDTARDTATEPMNDGRRSCDCLTRQLRCSVAATTLLVEREVERGETCEKHLEKRPG